MTEVEFFHHASRTLVLTDFIENFERDKLGSWWMRWLTRLGGVQDPHGSMPRDMRRTFVRQRPQLKAAVERMLAWERSEEHTSELQSLMRTSYAVFCLKKKKKN